MSGALLALIVVVAAAPAMVAGGAVVAWPALAIAAGALVAVARAIRPGEIQHLGTLVRPAAVLAAVPAAWMLIQILPLPVHGLANPMWDSAAAALGRPIAGSISIDTGASLLALAQYMATVGVALLAAAVSLDRQRAEWLLLALVAAAAAIAAVVIADAAGLALPGGAMAGGGRAAALDAVALGVVLAAAGGLRTFERFETRRASPGRSPRAIAAAAAGCAAALILEVAALALGGSGPIWFAAACGLAVMAAVVATRRLGLGPWGVSGLAAAALVIAAGVIIGQLSGSRPAHPTLAFAPAGAPIATTERILADAPWAGTGTGTFAALTAIYRDADEATADAAAPTAAAQIAVELGWPAPLVLMLIAAIATVALLRAALRRGRDSFYPAAGAAALAVLTVLAFANAGVPAPAPAILAAATMGLALAQSRSRIAV
ncbi:MAG: hypothetical protein ABSG76_11455 [Xanthobacteraceae bacterium]